MVIDSSVLVAILMREAEAAELERCALSGTPRLIASPALVETSMVILSRLGEDGLLRLGELGGALEARIVSFEPEHVDAAVDAFRRYGKGRHPAALNFGDCCTYALAKATGEPLLFKGDDFALTDLERVA